MGQGGGGGVEGVAEGGPRECVCMCTYMYARLMHVCDLHLSLLTLLVGATSRDSRPTRGL